MTGNLNRVSQENMRPPISVGVVGCGYWGPLLVRNFKGLPNCRLRAMCDVSEARLKHLIMLYPDVDGVTDYQRFLNDSALDAIVIATPVKHHFALAKASLLAGKHTFIEKPMASSSAECEELIDIAARNGLVLMIDHTFLYSTPVRKIREIVQSGEIGDIRYINSPPTQSGPLPAGHQCRLGSRAARHLDHSPHSWRIPNYNQLFG